MLSEIVCSLFRKNRIDFHNGLNIILGDDDAKNSIGKSSALMAVDFVHGGDSLLDDKSGAIREMGHHSYQFAFIFSSKKYFFSRSTIASDIVHVCDDSYTHVSEITIQQFRSLLKEHYGLEGCENSFRSLVSPFSRIWGKEGIEPDSPFVASTKEPSGEAIYRLIDLFGYSESILAEKKAIEAQKERKKIISGSMKTSIIPNINRAKYKENVGIIESNKDLIDNLKHGLGGALATYEALFDENLTALQTKKNELSLLRTDLQAKKKRLEREIAGITPRLSANISLVAEFFPNVNVERLEQVEGFHQKISSIVKKQLREDLSEITAEEMNLTDQISVLEDSIQSALAAKGMPDDIFKRVFDLKEVTDKAQAENGYFDQKKNLEDAIKLAVERLETIYSSIFLDIEAKLNLRLKSFNRVVYGAKRNSSKLRIKAANSYTFSSPADTGAGKSFAGLIGFDLAMLSSTHLPFVIHDSVIYKNIEVEATKRILRIMSFVKAKQIFLSFDEAHKFGAHVEMLVKKFTALELSHSDLLYTKDWREKSV